ncbi:MAG: class I SAM-dependent methyltransferase [Zoogloeaceae bacterium]|nr:class I SAM-dependent methyltransferase [Zoogloeaceae bacterium]
MSADHSALAAPSAWVARFAASVPAGSTVLDLACGGGRHARLFASRGCRVEAVDRDAGVLRALQGVDGVTPVVADLEEEAWPYAGRRFDAVVVTNYLYRPHFDALLDCIAPGGLVIYETFMSGNERFGRPSNPAFLLAPDELLQRVAGGFSVLAFEQGEVTEPKPAMVQRICARRTSGQAPQIP